MNVLVTGGARGIGRGLVRLLLQDGHSVYALDSNEAELRHTTERAEKEWSPSSNGSRFYSKTVDLSDRKAIHSSIQEISKAFDNRLDLLVNNAFATPHTWNDGKSMDDLDADIEEQWDLKLAVGLTAPFILSRLCASMLKGSDGRKPGSIINISSTRAHQAEDIHEAYSACKGGLLGLTQSMSVSLGHKHNIRVNSISPGWINVENENKEADMTNVKWEDGLTEDDHRWHPAGRVGKVEDIYKAVLFLAQSEFVTGQEVVVDGGVTRKMVYPE
ncbi:3-oxoacyl-reductase [Cystobasidium minutum MCA 4210]|uniref:3-oxoacyl-reductase n=1 Tax=Cystobasidium minutum MCA 4210 TaxID=1397322 RepID=UPI0034CE537F|eukprot:jgi/Rhomi1/80480/CE80479_706